VADDGDLPEEDYDPDWHEKVKRKLAEEDRQRKAQFWQARFGTPDCVGNYSFYAYEYLDDLNFMRPAGRCWQTGSRRRRSSQRWSSGSSRSAGRATG
jgi:hypothetical protein